jgi:hypothetical protein
VVKSESSVSDFGQRRSKRSGLRITRPILNRVRAATQNSLTDKANLRPELKVKNKKEVRMIIFSERENLASMYECQVIYIIAKTQITMATIT